jgi:GNAT superfamily N-acetyltransferase
LIRPYRSADRDAVIGIFAGFVRELAPLHLRAEFEAYIATAIREELGRIEEYYGDAFWVAEEAGEVVGMVGIERHSADAAELRRMAVSPACRRRGLARQLLHTAEDFARNAGYAKIVLSTSELQSSAMRLYESSAYRLVRTDIADTASHKTPGAGLKRYHFEKVLGR